MTCARGRSRLMPRCRSAPQSTAQLCLFALAAVSCSLSFASTTFMCSCGNPKAHGKSITKSNHQQHVEYTSVEPPVRQLFGTPESSTQHAMKLGCAVAVMLALAVRPFNGAYGDRSYKVKRRAIVCKALQADTICTTGSINCPIKTPSVTTGPASSATSLHTAPACDCMNLSSFSISATSPADSSACALTGLFPEMEKASSAARMAAPRRMQSARRVGKARTSHASARTARHATNTAGGTRKTVGSKLQKTLKPTVLGASYDPSCLRTRIQLGLRISSRIRSASGREFKTPSATKGLTKSSGVYILGSLFEATMESRIQYHEKTADSVSELRSSLHSLA